MFSIYWSCSYPLDIIECQSPVVGRIFLGYQRAAARPEIDTFFSLRFAASQPLLTKEPTNSDQRPLPTFCRITTWVTNSEIDRAIFKIFSFLWDLFNTQGREESWLY